MEDELHKRIIGQEDAVRAVSKAIRRTRAGLKDPKRPSGSFIFAGPSGVGKTELSKALAEFLFGDDDALIQIDMGEFHDRFTASRLFGAPPGYVGYEEGGQLTEKVRRKPFSVVLFDEIEKAHPDVFNVLLQLLDDGRLTDSKGRVVDFRNVVVIMTSNIGSPRIMEAAGDREKARRAVNEELNKAFRPELLNRIDDKVIFDPLGYKDMDRILRIQLKRVEKLLAARDLSLEISEAAAKVIVDAGYDPVFGARPLKRAITSMLLNPMSNAVLGGDYSPGDTVKVDVHSEDGKSYLQFERVPAPVVDEE
jgi:ATP-dependent Clp protease ATP-binding subunit ClpC